MKRPVPRVQSQPVVYVYPQKTTGFWAWVKRLFMWVGGFVVLSGLLAGLAIFILGNKPVALPASMVLDIRLEGDLPEQNRFAALDEWLGESTGTLLKLVDALERAEKDPRVKGAYITLGEGQYSPTQAETLHEVLGRFRAAGKFVHVYADSLVEAGNGMPAYQIAASSDHITLQPSGSLTLTGYAAELPYFKRLLDKVGIKAELGQREAYKTAPEPQLRDRMSAETLETITVILSTYMNEFLATISAERHKPVGNVLADMDDSMPASAEQAFEKGYVDAVDHQYNAEQLALETAGADAVLQDVFDYEAVKASHHTGLAKTGKKIALIYMEGVIVGGSQDAPEQITANVYADALQTVFDDPSIGALVVRVNSPGGSPQASEKIRGTLERIAESGIPVFVTMGSVAASGGYWVATSATEIFVQRTTLTGSIGVYGGKYDLSALAEKMGISPYIVTSGKASDMWSLLQPYSEAGKEANSRMLDTVYEDFKYHVAQGRNLSEEQVQNLAQGKVYTGAEALSLGLADTLGYERDALNKAAQKLGYKNRLETAVLNITPTPDPLGVAAEMLGVKIMARLQARLAAVQSATYARIPKF